MWLLLTIALADPSEVPRYLGTFTSRGACMAAASNANGPDWDKLRQYPSDGRVAVCFSLEYPT